MRCGGHLGVEVVALHSHRLNHTMNTTEFSAKTETCKLCAADSLRETGEGILCIDCRVGIINSERSFVFSLIGVGVPTAQHKCCLESYGTGTGPSP